jgi:hypothetical protein
VTIATSSSAINGFSDSTNKNPIWKKPILVGDTMFLAIAKSIVEQLQIDEHCWLEQIPTNGGIYMKILSKEDLPI